MNTNRNARAGRTGMRQNTRFWLLFGVLAVLPAGCGGVHPVVGGTPGSLHAGDDFLSDIQVTVYQTEGGLMQAVGFGVTDHDGAFELATNGARGPLRLAPGEYRCTLESAGAPLA